MSSFKSHIYDQSYSLSREDYSYRYNQKSFVLWFTGLSGSGKSSIASAVEKKLFSLNYATCHIDGDNLRYGLCSDLDFSNKDRKENIRRVGELSKLFVENGLITLTAFISPFLEDRARARSLLQNDDFLEIFVNCPLEICEERDVKGLYNKARNGQIKEFTGISSPYEPPINPELIIDTSTQTLEESVESVIELLNSRGLISDQH